MIRLYFGSPGCGKTTLAVKHAIQLQKYYSYVFMNFDHSVPGAGRCHMDKVGEWTFPEHSLVSIDESGIEYNNRSYKSLAKSAIEWYKTHRHYKVDLDLFSQSWEDTDVTLRRLTVELWYLKKIGSFTLERRIYKFVDVDQNTKQIIDGYKKASGLWLLIWFLQTDKFPLFQPKWKITYRPKYYKYFDSYSKADIPVNYFDLTPIEEEV